MKRLLLAIFCLLPLAARGASPEEDYFASRDQYIANFKSIEDGPLDDASYARHDAALADLGKQLRQIVGPFALQGFSAEGKVNLDTLFPSDEGFGLLDGLAYASKDEKTSVVVTTASLLAHWLKEHENWWEGFQNAPLEADAALQSEVFYSQAISTDAAFTIYAAIPITKPSAAKFAVALLAGRSQDVVPLVPDELLVSIVTGDRVFVVDAPAEGKITGIAACDKVWQDFEKKADEADQAYMASDPKDPKLLDAYNRIQQEGSGAFGRCFGERAPHEPFFPALVKQAQAIADSLPAK